MSRILISTDTTADLSKEIVDARGIKQLSLHVLLGEQEYIDGINISPRDIFDYVEKTHVLPKTSAAGIPEYTEFFAEQLKEYDSIIHFTISAELSSTFDNAQSASEQFNGKLSVVDSRNLSTGQGLLVLKACDLRDVGDKITINAETNGKSPLVGTEFTVTAIVEHPSYLRNENDYSRGFCGIGDGSVDYYAVASEKAFNREAYDYSFTQLLIKSEELDGLETFGDEYGEKASTIANRIKEVGSVRAGSRSDEIAAALDEKLAQARSEFAEKRQELVALRGKAEALYNRLEKTDELLKSYIAQPTEETLQAIADEVAQIFAENPDLVSQIVPAANEIGRLLEEYLKNPDSLTEKERKVVEQALDYMNLSKDAEGVAQLKDYLETAKSFAENYEKDPEGTLEALHGLIMMAVSLSPDLAGAEEKLCEKLGKVRGQIGAIDAAIAMLDELQGEKTPLATYSSGLIENAGEYTAKLEEAISQYRAALETRRNLVRYENWSVQKRTDNAGVVTAKYNAESSKKLCYTMSLLFVFVGMMVCYTTVSRNINESQVATGVQKALGFRGREILAHYTCYSVIAVLLGSLLGYALGYFVIETIVNHAYAKLYVFPYLPNTFTVPEALIITLVEIVLVCIATWLPCRKLLKRKAVELIRGDRGQNRPKAYWKLKIWKRLSLYTQTTINNLFGDGSRVIATLVGIAGCTALIVMSMSLRFSIVSTPEKHFSDIWVYDAFLVKDASVQNSEQNLTEVLDGEACDYIRVRRDVVYIEDENGSFSKADVIAPEKEEGFEKFVRLKDYKSGRPIALPEEGVIVSRTYEKYHNLKIGDTIRIMDTSGVYHECMVAGFSEHYLSTVQLAMSADYYERVTGKTYECNAMYINYEEASADVLREKLRNTPGYFSLTDERAAWTAKFAELASTTMLVIYIGLFLAAAMALLVLLNLNIVCVNEKKNELVIMRINGFSVGAAKKYVYRDNIVLTAIGIIVGTLCGIGFGQWMLNVLQKSGDNFYTVPSPVVCLIAIALTALFSLITNLIALRKVDKLSVGDLKR